MPIREEVPKSNKRQVVSAQSLADLATLAFEAGALAVGQSGADVKDPRSTPLQRLPMLGRASNIVRAATEGEFGPIEVFGEQTPWPGSKQVHGELTAPGIDGNFLSTEDVNLLDADTAHVYQSVGGWMGVTGFVGGGVVPGEEVLDEDATYGKAAKFVVDSLGNRQISAGSNSVVAGSPGWAPIEEGTSYTVTLRFRGTVSRDWRFFCVQRDATGASLRTNDSPIVAYDAADGYVEVSIYINNIATTAAWLQVTLQPWETDSGDEWYIDRMCVQAGADATFTPSIRIVGDLDIEFAGNLLEPASSDAWIVEHVDSFSVNNNYSVRLVSPNLWFRWDTTGNAGVQKAWVFPFGEAHTYRVTNRADNWDSDFYIDGISQGIQGSGATGDRLLSSSPLGVGGTAPGGTQTIEGDLSYLLVRDGIGGPIVAAFDAIDLAGYNIYDGQTFIDGITGRTWTVNGDNWPASIDIVEDDLTDEFGGFDDYDAAVEMNGIDQFVQTEDINLLDADTAHAQQSVGKWGNTGIPAPTVQTPPTAPPFGVTCLGGAHSADTANTAWFWNPTTGAGVPVSASTEYSASVWVYAEIAQTCRLELRDGDSGGATGNTAQGSLVSVPANTWTQLTVTATTASDAAFASLLLRQNVNGEVVTGGYFYAAATTLREGSDPTFESSFRFQSPFYMEMDVDMDWRRSGANGLMCRYYTNTNNRCFNLSNPSNGVLTASTTNNGTLNPGPTAAGSFDYGIPVGVARHIIGAYVQPGVGVRFDLDDVLLDDVAEPSIAVPFIGNSPTSFLIGVQYQTSTALGNPMEGAVHGVRLFDGDKDGPEVVRFDAKNMKEVGDLLPGFSHMGEDGRLWVFPNGATMKWSLKP